MSNKDIKVDDVIKGLQNYLLTTFDIKISDTKTKGLAFAALKEAGLLTKEDKYKTYDHVEQMLKLFNDAIGEEFIDWEDMECFTGNLYYTMRVATAKSVSSIQEVLAKYNDKQYEEMHTDLFMVQEELKKNMRDAWQYLERTQMKGAGIIITKLMKSKNLDLTEKK